jgi:hypothetical protein
VGLCGEKPRGGGGCFGKEEARLGFELGSARLKGRGERSR